MSTGAEQLHRTNPSPVGGCWARAHPTAATSHPIGKCPTLHFPHHVASSAAPKPDPLTPSPAPILSNHCSALVPSRHSTFQLPVCAKHTQWELALDSRLLTTKDISLVPQGSVATQWDGAFVMLQHDGKHSSNNKVAQSEVAANKNKPQYSNHGCKYSRTNFAYLWKASAMQGSPERSPHLHCQPLNEVWAGVDPGSSPSGHSDTLHTPELPWVGPAFHQVLNHCFKP